VLETLGESIVGYRSSNSSDSDKQRDTKEGGGTVGSGGRHGMNGMME